MSLPAAPDGHAKCTREWEKRRIRGRERKERTERIWSGQCHQKYGWVTVGPQLGHNWVTIGSYVFQAKVASEHQASTHIYIYIRIRTPFGCRRAKSSQKI